MKRMISPVKSMSHEHDIEERLSSAPKNNQSPPGLLGRKAIAFKEVIASKVFLLATTLAALAYLSFFKYLDIATDTPVMAAPSYFVLFYSLIAISSVLMGLSVYSLHSNFKMQGKSKSGTAVGSSSAASSLFGSVISCSCHTSLLLPLLTSAGFSAISGIGIIAALVEYQSWILAVFIILDFYLAYRVLTRIRVTRSIASYNPEEQAAVERRGQGV